MLQRKNTPIRCTATCHSQIPQGKAHAAALSKIVIERAWNQVRVTLHTARPGLVIGRKGQEIEVMSQKISEMCGGKSGEDRHFRNQAA
jgi:ribosomal protein S3